MLVLCWVAITGFFGTRLACLKTDFEFEKFFPADDPDIAFYEEHLRKFPYDNDYLIVILENEAGVFEQPFLEKVDQLSDSLKALPEVKQVINPITLKYLISGPLGVFPLPVIHTDDPSRYRSDSLRVYTHPLYSPFFDRQAQALMIQVLHQHLPNPDKSTQLASQVSTLTERFAFDHSRIVGKLVAQDEFISLIRKDFSVFMIAALGLCFVVLVVIFRSVKVALMPYAISVTSLIWLLGLMAIFRQPVTVLGSLIPPVILFVSSSDAIHFIIAFRKATGNTFSSRLKTAIRSIFTPTFLTSLTTAIGFFSLIFINTHPIRSLGVFTGTGILLAFVVTFAFGPLLIRQSARTTKPSDNQRKMAIWVLRHPALIMGSTLLVIVASVWGITLMETNAYLLDDLPERSEAKKDFMYADRQFGGSKPWELAYWPADTATTIWEPAVMDEARKIQEYLDKRYPVERLWSPVSFILYGNQMTSGGLNGTFSYPDKDNYRRALKAVKPLTGRKELPKLVNEEQNYARFTGYIPEYGSRETIRRNEELLAYLQENIDPDILTYRLTGTTYLIDKSHKLLSANLLKGLLVAIAIISLIMGVYFKSWKTLAISLLPNIIPLLIAAGYMGFAGIPLKLTTSIIFAVVFGIAVDDTIHFISVYRKQKGANRVINLIRTYQTAGEGILVTTVIIVAGFALLIFSSFGATYLLGIFLSLSLITALVTDLTLLPLLLHYSEKNKRFKKTTQQE